MRRMRWLSCVVGRTTRDCIYRAAWARRIITNLCVSLPSAIAYLTHCCQSPWFISIFNLRSDPCLGPPCAVLSLSHFPSRTSVVVVHSMYGPVVYLDAQELTGGIEDVRGEVRESPIRNAVSRVHPTNGCLGFKLKRG